MQQKSLPEPIYLNQVQSTNTYMLENLTEFFNASSVYSLNQSHGRGTKNRAWIQPEGAALALSVMYIVPVEKLPALSLVCGLAVVQALQEIGISANLKWSNDVVVSSNKLGGILCESKIQKDSAAVVFGIGINLYQTKQDFIKMGLDYATSLQLLGKTDILVEDLLQKIRFKLDELMGVHLKEGFEKTLLNLYKKRCLTLNREVLIHRQGAKIKARALDIGPDGALICDVKGEIHAFYSGEVSVRGLYGYI